MVKWLITYVLSMFLGGELYTICWNSTWQNNINNLIPHLISECNALCVLQIIRKWSFIHIKRSFRAFYNSTRTNHWLRVVSILGKLLWLFQFYVLKMDIDVNLTEEIMSNIVGSLSFLNCKLSSIFKIENKQLWHLHCIN